MELPRERECQQQSQQLLSAQPQQGQGQGQVPTHPTQQQQKQQQKQPQGLQVQTPPIHSVVPIRTTQSVSFSDLDNQERSRRFTISAHPSTVNVSNQEYKASPQSTHSQTPQNINSHHQLSALLTGPTSRKTSLTQSRNNSSTNDVMSFMTSSNHNFISNQLKQNLNINHEFISSNSSSRVNSPIESTPLKHNFSFELTNENKNKSPSPPPAAMHSKVESPSSTSCKASNTNSPSQLGVATFPNSSQPIIISSGNVSRRNSTKKSNKTIVASPVGPPVPFQRYLSKEDDGKFHILLGCTGSVATIKVPLIIDKLFQTFGKTKISIQLVVTKSAGHFLKGLKIHNDVKIWRDEDEWANYNEESLFNITNTIAANLSNHSNLNPASAGSTKKHKNPFDKLILHNELRRWADIMLIAPLSANSLAKITNGIADNLLTSIIRSWGPSIATSQQGQIKKPILVAPAMNTFMYTHPITAKQLAMLVAPEYGFGMEILKPVEKVLVCGDIGMGGMREWSDIVEILRRRVTVLKAESKKRDEIEKGKVITEQEEDFEEDADEEDEEDDDDDDDNDDDEDDDDEDEDDDDESENGLSAKLAANTKILGEDPELNEDMIFDITDQEGDEANGEGNGEGIAESVKTDIDATVT